MSQQYRQRDHRDHRDAARDTMPHANEKLLPQNVEAEVQFLGCLLMDPEALVVASTRIKPHMMYREAHREILTAQINTLLRERVYDPTRPHAAPGDLIVTIDELMRTDKLDAAGGASYVSSLVNFVPHSNNWEYYAEIVERCYVQRQAIKAAGEIAALAYSGAEITDLRTHAYELIDRALGITTEQELIWFGDVVRQLYSETEARSAGDVAGKVIQTGFPLIDQEIAGIERGELVVVASRPSVGKSAFGQRLLLNMLDTLRVRAESSGEPMPTALYVTLEMSPLQQVRRMIATHADVDSRAMRLGFRDVVSGDIDAESFGRFSDAVGETDSIYHRMIAFPRSELDVFQLSTLVRRAVVEHHCAVVVIDQLDLFEDPEEEDWQGRRRRKHSTDERSRISEAVRELKKIATRYDVAIIALAQLNRDAEGVRPQLHHLRMSDRIGMDADMVIMLYRPIAAYPAALDDPNYAYYGEALLAKVRGGTRGGLIPLWFNAQRTLWLPWPDHEPLPELPDDVTGGSKASYVVSGDGAAHTRSQKPSSSSYAQRLLADGGVAGSSSSNSSNPRGKRPYRDRDDERDARDEWGERDQW